MFLSDLADSILPRLSEKFLMQIFYQHDCVIFSVLSRVV
jgi:hypothetical protein